MSERYVTVDQAAETLRLHAKTVLRYIREGRLAATRIGKSYRIAQRTLDAFAGAAQGKQEDGLSLRTTCVVDITDISVERAERLASFLQAAALTGTADTPSLNLQTVYDPVTSAMKLFFIGAVGDVARLLAMVEVHVDGKP